MRTWFGPGAALSIAGRSVDREAIEQAGAPRRGEPFVVAARGRMRGVPRRDRRRSRAIVMAEHDELILGIARVVAAGHRAALEIQVVEQVVAPSAAVARRAGQNVVLVRFRRQLLRLSP